MKNKKKILGKILWAVFTGILFTGVVSNVKAEGSQMLALTTAEINAAFDKQVAAEKKAFENPGSNIDTVAPNDTRLHSYPVLSAPSAPPVIAATQFNYTLLESFPGFFDAGSKLNDLPAMILAIYKFGIWTVGIAGLFMLVIGGFMYMASAGNNSTLTTAKGIIWDALLGIVAAMGAYLILYIINPDLTKLNLSFTPVKVSETEGSGGSTAGNSTGQCVGALCNTVCKPGTFCVECKSCGNFSNGYSALCFNNGTVGSSGCKLNSTLASKLNSAGLGSVGAQVSEAWPPTVRHSSRCHQDGTCADIRCNAQCDNVSIENIKKIYDTIKNAGLSPVFETKKDCAPYKSAGIINCAYYSTMTSPSSFHVNLP